MTPLRKAAIELGALARAWKLGPVEKTNEMHSAYWRAVTAFQMARGGTLYANNIVETDTILAALDAERAAAFEEARAWLDSYATDRAKEADEHRGKRGSLYIHALADGADDIETAFGRRFLSGEEPTS